MSRNSALKARGSLLERAAEIYDFSSGLRVEPLAAPVAPAEEPHPEPLLDPVQTDAAPEVLDLVPAEVDTEPMVVEAPVAPRRTAPAGGRFGRIDREALEKAGYILPGAPVTGLAEEFRIIKRQLLLGANGGHIAEEKRRTILVCSSQSDEGKSFSAVNLALSLATEKDLEVLLVDGDFNNPEVLSILGLEDGPGLIDAIADPAADAEAFVIRTDIEGLSVLPAGTHANNVTELLASDRTRQVLADLAAGRPRRIVLFDSPPALMASPATVMATHVGQVLMVVRADVTTEADLREAVALLSGCDHLSLMLNAAGFSATGRRFGSYYGYGHD